MKKVLILTFIFCLLFIAGCKKQTDQLNNNKIDTNVKKIISTKFPTKTEITENTTATLKTNFGDIKVKFYPQDAPNTVANFIKLAEEGFYDGVKFHRVIKGFMIQAGDPNSKDDKKKQIWGTGGPGYTFENEFNNHKLVKGSLAMANYGPNTNGSQFFIVTAQATPWLDGRHTNFGQVIEGMDVVEAIENTQTGVRDIPVQPIIIESIIIE
jgi:cyclophilin family peptidyl-prolyl cis-trans isomerase